MLESDNKIMVGYTGDEDEIVKKLEAGDVSLSLPKSYYMSSLPAHKGLFGINAQFQLGPIDMYAIASREEALSAAKEFTGTVEKDSISIYDTYFSRNKYFFIFYKGMNVHLSDSLYITSLHLFKSHTGAPPQDKIIFKGIATVWPSVPDSVPTEGENTSDRKEGDFIEIDPQQFRYDKYTGFLELMSPLQDNYSLSAVCSLSNGTTIGGNFVSEGNDSALVMLMIWPDLPDTTSKLWNNQLRNIYPLTSTPSGDISVKIIRIDPGGTYTEKETDGPFKDSSFAYILGIDPNNDGKLAYPQYDAARNIIIFPSATPFQDSMLSIKDSILYRKHDLTSGDGKRYMIVLTYTKETDKFNLNAFDIIKGSVRMIVNGEEWKEGVDFTVDYFDGTVTPKRPISPGDDIKITYESQSFSFGSEKVLAGTRIESEPFTGMRLGFGGVIRTVKKSASFRPQLGEESFTRALTELNIGYNKDLTGLTHFIDKLPFISTDKPSHVSLKFDAAMSFPNPNVMNIASVEDFEGSKETRNVDMKAAYFYEISLPYGKDTLNYSRNKIFKKNVTVSTKEVYGSQSSSSYRTDSKTALLLRFGLDSTINYTGVMRCINTTGENIEGLDNLEIVYKSISNRGILHIDFGTNIPEDQLRLNKNGEIIGLEKEDTEDKNNNNRLDKLTEDTGLDGIKGDDKNSVEGDDGNDDYSLENNPGGTEDNDFFDTEDLNKDGGFNERGNDYFTLQIDLSSSNFITELENGWKLLRIPLNDSSLIQTIGNPIRKKIVYTRIWIEGNKGIDTLILYSMEFNGTSWKNPHVFTYDSTSSQTDTSEIVHVSRITKYNYSGYTSPYSVADTVEEASLSLTFSNIKKGHGVIISKYDYNYKDFRMYKRIKFYIHKGKSDPYIFIRFGTDSLNYYHYTTKISTGERLLYGDGNWYEFSMPVDSLAMIKVEAEKQLHSAYYERNGFGVEGTPSFSSIRYMAIGVENRDDENLTDEIWIDDIRLTDVRKNAGKSYTASFNLRLADISTFNIRNVRQDGYFIGFTEPNEVRNGNNKDNISLSLGINLEKIGLNKTGISLPLSYTYSTSKSSMIFSPLYPDYIMPDSESVNYRNANESQGFSLSYSKKKSRNPLFNYTIDNIRANIKGDKRWATSNGGLYMDSSSSFSYNTKYTLEKDFYIKIFKQKYRYLPHRVMLQIDGSKRLSKNFSRASFDSSFTLTTMDKFNRMNLNAAEYFSPFKYFDNNINLGYNFDLNDRTDTILSIPIGYEGSQLSSSWTIKNIDLKGFGKYYFNARTHFSDDFRKEIRADSLYHNYANSFNVSVNITNISIAEIIRGKDQLKTIKNDSTTKDSTTHPLSSILKFYKDVTGFLKIIRPISVNLTYNQHSSYPSINQSIPDIYKLGIIDTLPFESRTNWNRGKTYSTSANTGLTYKEWSLMPSISASRNISATSSMISISDHFDLPRLDINYSGLSRYLKALFSSIQLRTSYARGLGRSGTITNDSINFNAFSETHNLSPLLGLSGSFKNSLGFNVNVNYSFTNNTSYSVMGEVLDKDINAGVTGNFTYSFREGLSIPILKKLHIKNNISTVLDLSYTKHKKTRTIYLSEPTIVNLEDIYSVKLNATYQFSRSLTGGLDFGVRKHLDPNSVLGNKTSVDVNVHVNFKF